MVSKLSSEEVLNFLIIVSVILAAARILGEICKKLKQPAVIGEIFAGILLGPSLFGAFFPNTFQHVFISQPRSYAAFDGLANVGIILLMFIAGFEVDLKQIRKQGKQAASISILGLIFPFMLGFATVYFFYDNLFSSAESNRGIAAMFFGTALSITALSVIAKILLDMDMLRSKIGNLILTAAMINDFLGWILFSIIIQLMNTGKQEGSFTSVSMVLLYTGVLLTIGRWLVDKILMIASKFFSIGVMITLAVCLCLLSAVLTEFLGVRGIFGAFIMGVAVGDSKFFPEKLQQILHQFVINIIAPLFFASIGLRVNFIANFNIEIILITVLIASVAKIIGSGIGGRISGLSKNESNIIAFGMNARGSQEIVLGALALQAKIIDEQVFVALIVMTIVSILIAGPAMKYYLNKEIAEKKLAEPQIAVVTATESKVAG
ncbi:cation:proton antiporter [Parafilimonas terrae]|uniref:Kef-type K+ transport system, membrane component KefB n=1 Tax=Parafilimonas terrae TaxID=1465490 RepID=A0A1I5X0S5_9BACT|nr:cation:proton antiporter [Parafilimonas terrae]SFQ25538.1 Kef-type K+ transport system, membrane component KefB [Parafilimonas terrae]